MKNSVLSKVDSEIAKYKIEHSGEGPLFILISPHEADALFDEIRKAGVIVLILWLLRTKGSK